MAPTAPATAPLPLFTGANPDREIKLVSHSSLFYWWPVWALGFFLAAWTSIENSHLAVVPSGAVVSPNTAQPNVYTVTLPDAPDERVAKSFQKAVDGTGPRVSKHAWMGSVFVIVLILNIVITNVPMRGLWSFVAIIMVVVVALLITLFHAWDEIFERVGNLHIYINMAGYLTIATVLFIVWAVATFFFDRRAFIIFTPGQIKVCEHIGASVRTYDTMGLTFEKQRDDLFRHYILGFGSGDLIVRTSGAERHEIKLQNVLGIGWKLKPIEDMLREKAIIHNP